MDHYLDIHLRPDPEVPAHQLMAALFAKLHRVLAQVQATTIGVSFPGYGLSPVTLGNTLRLVGPAVDLARLMEESWLTGARDHTKIDAINLKIVSNAGSKLYTEDQSAIVFLTAKQLMVSYSNWALFQNRANVVNSNRAGGVVLGPNSLKLDGPTLVLDASGSSSNTFALFGKINGFVGRPAGLLPEVVLSYSTSPAVPRVVKITQQNSRVNGCVIGSPDKGCLITDTPPPTINMFDERQVQIFDTGNGDNRVVLDPVVGANNEALIGDIATPQLNYDLPNCKPGQIGCREGKRK